MEDDGSMGKVAVAVGHEVGFYFRCRLSDWHHLLILLILLFLHDINTYNSSCLGSPTSSP